MGRRRKITWPPWLVPAIIAAFLFAAGVPGNLIATYIEKDVEPYRHWVYVVFALAVIAAAAAVTVAVRASRKRDEPETAPISVASLHQLPSPPKDFTGRKAELDDLLDKVKKGGIAISGLQGAGGIGKTVLALMLAEQLASRYPDAQIYLDLRGVSPQPMTPAEAMAYVIHSWDRTESVPQSEAELSARYRDVLHGKRVLLLLDNAADADQVLPLLPPEGCLALVTSRQHFALPGCYTRSLDMLTPEDARDLVLRIAPRVAEQADDVAELCGYLPFALRNAASALESRKDISPADYMQRLGEAKERLSLIDASLSSSYDVLSAEQQERWRMLGVFPGSFDAPAAAAVWEVEEDRAKDELGELYLRSMVECETDGRYKLHDLSRVYADSKLSETERAAAQHRHAEHYLRVARTAEDLYEKGGESVLAGLGLFDLERGNIETGQRWASQYEQDDDRAAGMCIGYAPSCPFVLLLRLHPQEWIQWLNSALQGARRLKDRSNEAATLNDLGLAYGSLGEYHRAIGLHERSLAIAREIGAQREEAVSLCNLGCAYHSLGEYHRAIESYEQHLAIARDIGDRLQEGNALGGLGNAHYSLGEYPRAIEFYQQWLAMAREIGNRHGEAQSLGSLGNAYYSLGEAPRAIEFHEQQLVIAREIGDRSGEGTALWNMSLALDQLGERERAIANARPALSIFEQIEDPDAAKVRRQLALWQGEGQT